MANPDPEPRDLRNATDDEVAEIARSLYERVGPAVIGLGHRYFAGRRDLAEELVAETFARVLVGLRRFDGRAAYRTWIFRIAMNVAARWIRDKERRSVESLESDPVDRSKRDDPLVVSERNELVDLAVRALSPEHRMVIALVVDEGLSQAEVAELLGVPPGTIWSRYARARLALARSLAALGDAAD